MFCQRLIATNDANDAKSRAFPRRRLSRPRTATSKGCGPEPGLPLRKGRGEKGSTASGMVQERPFSGNTWAVRADPDRSASERVYAAIWLAWTAAALVTRKPGVPQIFQPVCVPLPRQ